jgi:low temperature requirement protein LtrA
VVYRLFPFSHVIGLALLAILVPFAYYTDQLMISGLTTVILIVVAIQESISRRRTRRAE